MFNFYKDLMFKKKNKSALSWKIKISKNGKCNSQFITFKNNKIILMAEIFRTCPWWVVDLIKSRLFNTISLLNGLFFNVPCDARLKRYKSFEIPYLGYSDIAY